MGMSRFIWGRSRRTGMGWWSFVMRSAREVTLSGRFLNCLTRRAQRNRGRRGTGDAHNSSHHEPGFSLGTDAQDVPGGFPGGGPKKVPAGCARWRDRLRHSSASSVPLRSCIYRKCRNALRIVDDAGPRLRSEPGARRRAGGPRVHAWRLSSNNCRRRYGDLAYKTELAPRPFGERRCQAFGESMSRKRSW